ncbi:MAG: hypothetical protein F6K36_09335 [Symploca sp. SIO3C6]|uniref:Uncharacterized protein n=1 Tax=Symploca sp. SIO1C4 TaxID=2607765 RepID=A0A6B3NGM2_9CYAN|nr:hypothetical protein [Symploca sp. SIO3C6]NER30847.1 hypothetical protein [Symploca sp. SIO1C4]NET04913.1 hypothetical protein [Symploca sp. SIO2B6]
MTSQSQPNESLVKAWGQQLPKSNSESVRADQAKIKFVVFNFIYVL